jgi:hypothetical protein
VDERDIWRSAQAMIKRYGADAVVQASLRADALLEKGDREGQRTWIRVIAAIRELQNTIPNGSTH